MVIPPGQRVGVAAIRVWVDDQDPPGLRVRVSTCDDIADPVGARQVFASARETADSIYLWLRGFEEPWTSR